MEQDLYALVDDWDRHSHWARSTDGGGTWQPSESPATAPGTPLSAGDYQDPGPAGPLRACTSDGTCWRLRERRAIERIAVDGQITEELRLANREFSDISTGCAGGSIGVLGSIAATEVDGVPHVVASLGAQGVMVRRDDGAWDRVRVLSAPPAEASGFESAAVAATLLFGPVLALVVWLVGRHRWSSWRNGLTVTIIGWCTILSAAAALSFVAAPDTNPMRIAGRVAIAGMIVTTGAAIIAARRPARPRPRAAFPPPPFPPPPFPPPPFPPPPFPPPAFPPPPAPPPEN